MYFFLLLYTMIGNEKKFHSLYFSLLYLNKQAEVYYVSVSLDGFIFIYFEIITSYSIN